MADEDDFDEDVIIPNSPLSKYLQGLENSEASNLIESSSPIEKDDQECSNTLPETKSAAFSQKPNFFSRMKYFAHVIGSIFCLPSYNILCASLLNSSILYFNRNAQNELLIPEDKAFVESLLKSENVNKWPAVCKIIRIWILLTVTLFMFYYLIVTNRDFLKLCYSCYLITCSFGILSLLSLGIVVYSVVMDTYFNLFYQETVQILKLIKRSIRLVQESELTARGFTSASSIGAAERIELSSVLPFISSNKQCLKLRRFLFKEMKDMFLCYKRQTVNLIQSVPLEPLYDFSSSLAQLEIEEFGAFLTCDLDSSEISKLTDGFSISSLKTMYRLTEMQISEYFRYTCVVLFFISDNDRKDCCEQIWDLYNIKTAMNVLSKTSKPLFLEIEKKYHIYQSIEASYIGDSAPKSPKALKTPVSKLKVTVHNMCLHLKAALLRAVEVENQLHSINDPPCQGTLQLLDSLLQVVNNEVSAFRDCSEDCAGIIYDILHPPKKDSLEVILPSVKEQVGSNSVPKVIEKCDIEREIEDEVFEAMILTSETKNGRSDGMSHGIEDSKKNVELTANLLSELKNVLVPKADEHRVREQKALAKKSKDTDISDLEDIPSKVLDTADNMHPVNEEDCNSKINFELELNKSELKLESVPDKNETNLGNSLVSDVQMAFPNPFIKPNDSFAMSIASLAAQRQKMLGLSSDEYVVEGSDYSDSDGSD